ncbi:3-hydroxyacyl-CoA dehydrogenase family protein [Robiginitalea biformata]|uniref:3-hydroxybutyryl-CoA dehydrogenase n=1 Tax=Robiginitalea biformata (strain ATCC BAA-864 / DSM 15991 / KCTC 12146 / HTCC2501) TaxID=313596 RepID=A4CLT6_ROBBH|nr:3-hydroxyacyl-CoA dehydrogenase NAD-binding domain-containing protein [Robiginitalea biformata]EAR15835.1 3-hydroxybutyryl-CoA dehydrogenase [Robiginitalea biformata HTCC2501]
MKNISVVGAGTMGNGIAHVFAQHDYNVQLIDISEDSLQKGMETIERNLRRMVAKGTIESESVQATLGNIQTHTSLSEGVAGADLVVEAATENAGLKMDVFRELDASAPEDAILASNTSSISITEIAAATGRPEKVIGMHFMNPVPLMQLVEVIRGYSTSDAVTRAVLDLSVKLGKTPTEVNDCPGFVANRILMPMINEAIESLYTGVAGVQEIDTVMKLGMGHPMGPLQLADFIGLDVCLSILDVLSDGFRIPKYAACPLLRKMVTAGKLGVKSGEGFYDYSESRKAERVSRQFS